MFPHRLSSDTQEGIEEERRLCYVGITRAMERAYLTSAELRRTFNEVYHKEPSRFIFEIPEDLLQIQTHYESGYQGSSYRRSFAQEKKTYTESHFTREEIADEDTGSEPDPDAPTDGPSESKFRVRENVMHPKYGVGRVLRIEGSGDNLKLTILFGRGTKTFLEKYTPLEKAE
jgi:DNA helicase II / ATP-dependent DNA helicase PcrA